MKLHASSWDDMNVELLDQMLPLETKLKFERRSSLHLENIEKALFRKLLAFNAPENAFVPLPNGPNNKRSTS